MNIVYILPSRGDYGHPREIIGDSMIIYMNMDMTNVLGLHANILLIREDCLKHPRWDILKNIAYAMVSGVDKVFVYKELYRVLEEEKWS